MEERETKESDAEDREMKWRKGKQRGSNFNERRIDGAKRNVKRRSRKKRFGRIVQYQEKSQWMKDKLNIERIDWDRCKKEKSKIKGLKSRTKERTRDQGKKERQKIDILKKENRVRKRGRRMENVSKLSWRKGGKKIRQRVRSKINGRKEIEAR